MNKKNLKAIVLPLMMAACVAIALTQCKKTETPTVTPTDTPTDTVHNPTLPEGETVTITLKVQQDNSKLTVNPPHVTFDNGDIIYAVSNGVYVGPLTYNGTEFEGEIAGATPGKLYFYLLGNLDSDHIEWTTNSGSKEFTGCTVNISDQSSTLPVLSCAPSYEEFTGSEGITDFTATLLNKCGLVKFVTNVPSSTLTLSGLYNTANVSFAESTITPATTTGTISFDTDSEGIGWAILLPQAATDVTVSSEGYEGTTVALSAITNNAYLSDGIEVSLSPASTLPEFSVGENTRVYFSSGNLQWSGTNGWRFAPHQYDFIGGNVNNTTPTVSDGNYMDLFCWGATGLNGVAPNTLDTYYTGGSNLTGNNDWGACMGEDWRPLTSAEWDYLFNSRTNASSKYGLATVNDVKGLIILPDNYSGSAIIPFDPVNYESNTWDANEYNDDAWTAMENQGVVFLPAAGYRSGTNFIVGMNGSGGFYWSSTGNGSDNAGFVMFDKLNFK